MALQLNDKSFEEEVLKATEVVLVDFWAPWCGPCQMLGPIIEEIAEELKENKEVKVCKLNVDEASETAQKYGVMSIPVLKFFKNGNIVAELVGLQAKEVIMDKMNELIAN